MPLCQVENTLEKYLQHSELNVVKPKLQELVDGSHAVNKKWEAMEQHEGLTLAACVEGLRTSKNPPTKDEIGHLEKAMVDVKKVLQSVYGDLVNLRGGTHGVVDVERHRTAELTADAQKLLPIISAKGKEKLDIQNIIEDSESDIKKMEEDVRKLENGWFVKEETVKKAKEKLSRKRRAEKTLQLVAQRYEDKLIALKDNLDEKKGNLATLKDLDETMKSAPGDVDGIVKSLAVTIKCLVTIELGLRVMQKSPDGKQALEFLLAQKNVESLEPPAKEIYEKYTNAWSEVSAFIKEMV